MIVGSGLIVLAVALLPTVFPAPLLSAPVSDTARGARPPPPDLECSLEGDWIAAHVSVPAGESSDLQRREVLDSLERGLTAGIVFQVRLYAPARGFAAFLGDRLLAEMTVTRTVRWDPFVRSYVMSELIDDHKQTSEQTPLSEVDSAVILDAFFATRGGRIAAPTPLPAGAYVLARYRLSPIQIEGGLRIVSVFSPELRARDSPWSRRDLGGDA